jgi:hypothetical protein
MLASQERYSLLLRAVNYRQNYFITMRSVHYHLSLSVVALRPVL